MIAGFRKRRFRRFGGVCGAAAAVCCGGCASKPIEPIRIENVSLGPMTIAVAPALNVSGSPDLDPNRVADLMASELSHADGIDVIPVSRVLSVLADQGLEGVKSSSHALEIAGLLGADAVLVFAVTEYDPYDPPVVGITAQLFGRRRDAWRSGLDPVTESRSAAPGLTGRGSSALGLLAECARVYDASHEWVCAEVRRFAESRSPENRPLGWRKYVVSQQHYLRFCCYATIRSLIGGQGGEAAETKETTG